LTNVLGFDIGGANTKAAFVVAQECSVKIVKVKSEYFPVWKKGKDELSQLLKTLAVELVGSETLDAVGATMTAELSDAFFTKKEGVNYILDCLVKSFSNVPIFILNTEAKLVSVDRAREEPLDIAAANWSATGWMILQMIGNCIIVDVGSTTASIIPVVQGKIVAKGKTDLEKLMNGELVYTGSLRTNVATILNSVPLRGRKTMVSSEFFAQSGDAHLVLGNISEQDYTVETPDGRGKTKKEAMARLARVVCADIDMLSEKEIMSLAQQVWKKQIERISKGLKSVYDRLYLSPKRKIPIVVTGMGKDFLAKKAAQKVGFKQVINIGELLSNDVAVMSPSVGVALIVTNELEGKMFDGNRRQSWWKSS
jgi:probable H4MPT-linked C1 transfer pathway protein